MIDSTDAVVILSRGSLTDDSARLAVRVALALPLAGSQVILALVDTASAVALSGTEPDGRARQLSRELDSLTGDEEVPILVERESLERLGMADRTLRPGAIRIDREELEHVCLMARSCLVL
ncbi:MAG: DsrE family protein [Candidatus Dormibacteria bacterium]|jgi:hypothetical protein